MARLAIGYLAKATGTKVETIRHHERTGPMPEPGRTGGNYLSYEEDHLRRLSFIRRARDLGFSIGQVRELLGLAEERGRSCEAVDAIARAHLAETERKITDLNALRHELAKDLANCGRGTVADCRIIEALTSGASG